MNAEIQMRKYEQTYWAWDYIKKIKNVLALILIIWNMFLINKYIPWVHF
jgi:hypothetical protein